jgi:hypothetical protein
MDSKAALVALLAALACSPPRSRQPMSAASSAVASSRPDSLIHNDVVYRGRVTVLTVAGEPTLDVRVALRNLRPDTLTVESEAGGCNPPLYLRPAFGGRWIVWSDAAWLHSRRVICTGTGLLVSMTAGGHGELEPRTYPVRAIRGDSLSAGLYEAAVGVAIERAMRASTGFVSRWDTLRVPAGRVTTVAAPRSERSCCSASGSAGKGPPMPKHSAAASWRERALTYRSDRGGPHSNFVRTPSTSRHLRASVSTPVVPSDGPTASYSSRRRAVYRACTGMRFGGRLAATVSSCCGPPDTAVSG